jgi:NAD(P)-dependent dehydrogenase (short-subunit alcohol dehydrogenase family)
MSFLEETFSLQDKVAIVTGSTGVLGGAMAHGLARAGARVGIVGRRQQRAEAVAQDIVDAGGVALALPGDVLDAAQLETLREQVIQQWGSIDILVNAAGGNVAAAVIMPDQSFFDMPRQAFDQVVELNLQGSVLPSQIFGRVMAEQGSGCIVNISSMAALRTLTRVVGYAAAKAGISNFTSWLAVEMAQKYGSGLRVNAIAPGFFIGEQNRDFLLHKDGSPTPRGQQIIDHTPMGRFGEADELVGALLWLCSDAARFVTGIVVPVDGGFSAYSGV